MVIGYVKAMNLMKQLDWKMLVTIDSMDTLDISRIEVYHPKQPTIYTVRRDSGKKLMKECRVIGPKNDKTTILCYNHDGSDETLI